MTPAEPKLAGRVAVISGGDSGIERAAALAFASEGADVAILYLNEHKDAKETVRAVEMRAGAGWPLQATSEAWPSANAPLHV